MLILISDAFGPGMPDRLARFGEVTVEVAVNLAPHNNVGSDLPVGANHRTAKHAFAADPVKRKAADGRGGDLVYHGGSADQRTQVQTVPIGIRLGWQTGRIAKARR